MSLYRKSNKPGSARQQIDISAIRDDVLVLGGGRFRTILKTSAINFELKSEAEQDAVIDTYQSLINSLAVPVQILVRIRELDTEKYLSDLRDRSPVSGRSVYALQLKNYSGFMKSLARHNKILSRSFYVVVPHDDNRRADFDAVKESLLLNTDIVVRGLARLGIQAQPLNSLEILELFYGFYSPVQAKTQPLSQTALKLASRAFLSAGARA